MTSLRDHVSNCPASLRVKGQSLKDTSQTGIIFSKKRFKKVKKGGDNVRCLIYCYEIIQWNQTRDILFEDKNVGVIYLWISTLL